MTSDQQAQQLIANIPHQLSANLLSILEQHWAVALFVVALVAAKVYADLKMAAKRARARRNHQDPIKRAIYDPKPYRRRR